jgi:hypothetical protein
VGKVYNLYRVKTDRSAVLTVKSGLDPHMIIKLENGIQIVGYLWFGGINFINAKFLGWYILILSK